MPVLTKRVYEDGADVVGVLSVRFSLAGLALLALARLRGERLPSGRGLGTLALLGGVGYATQSLCYFSALERISAGLTALLLYFYPALVVLLTAIVLRVRPRAAVVGCVVVATAGTALTVGPVGGPQAGGVALGLGAALAYAVYVVLSSRVLSERGVAGGTGPLATSAVVMLACGSVYDVLALTRGASLPSEADGWAALAGVALICTVIAVATFFAALSRLGPADVSVLSTVEPVISVAVAAAVLGERLGGLQVAGGVLVLVAVAALARLEPSARRDEDEVPA
jgi:drug/metabolite transporter (DMT)-like permease